MTPFDALGNKAFENTVGKGEIARNEREKKKVLQIVFWMRR